MISALENKINILRDELNFTVNKWVNLQYEVYPKLTHQYTNLFGPLEYKLRNKSLTSEIMKIKTELLLSKIKEGVEITQQIYEEIDLVAQKQADYSSKNKDTPTVEESKDIFDKMDHIAVNPLLPIKRDSEQYGISKMYRDLVKRLHPDCNEKTSLFERYWAPVQGAYQNNNVERLSLYHKILCPYDYKNFREQQTQINQLCDHIRDLEMSLEREKSKIAKILETEPFSLQGKIENDRWISRRRQKLESQIFYAELSIRKNERKLRAITDYSMQRSAS
ncbi:MAG: hypothetical protein B7C24_16360 [Bacteroidetes bacterium 4572_77]|nr:MAG: hypothetical protein B7C24_16360 [Bacteroidetes bacterium 4572_77]